MQDSINNIEVVSTDTAKIMQNNDLANTSVTVPVVKRDHSKDITSAIYVTGISMVAIFVFMFVFFLVIKGIDKYFPWKAPQQ